MEFLYQGNLTMRMQMRRFTRLTNVALHFVYYNFCRVHQSLRVTPAMEAGISDHVHRAWFDLTIVEGVALLRWEPPVLRVLENWGG